MNKKLFIIFVFFIIILIFFQKGFILSSNYLIKDPNKEIKDIQDFININLDKTLYNKNYIFKRKIENPKISIIITVYNGEGYIETALHSIQNQDFKEIEIIILDDCSKDNSISLIKQLMKNDYRISLYKNKENKGMLYTKTQGVLKAKGKYILILDVDDMYTQRNVFSTLFKEADKNNLDLLGFGGIISNIALNRKSFINYLSTPILFQPDVSKTMYYHDSENQIKRGYGGFLAFYFMKREKLVRSINQISKEFMNSKMNFHDDLLVYFILSRNVNNLRQIRRIFYIVVDWENNINSKMAFRLKEKNKNRENIRCFSYIKYIQFILLNTNNTLYDKKIASFEIKRFYINHECKNNTFTQNMGRNICQLFLKNQYIENKEKLLKNFLKAYTI